MLLDCVIFIYYLTHLELFVAFSKVKNQFVSSFKHDSIIKETRGGGNSNFDVILQILMRNEYYLKYINIRSTTSLVPRE